MNEKKFTLADIQQDFELHNSEMLSDIGLYVLMLNKDFKMNLNPFNPTLYTQSEAKQVLEIYSSYILMSELSEYISINVLDYTSTGKVMVNGKEENYLYADKEMFDNDGDKLYFEHQIKMYEKYSIDGTCINNGRYILSNNFIQTAINIFSAEDNNLKDFNLMANNI